MRPLFCCVALAAMLTLVPAGFVPAQTGGPSPPPWLNPFCAVSASVVPWDTTTNSPAQTAETASYRVQLRSEKPGSTLDAHVTLVGDSGLYDARVHLAPLSGRAFEQATPPLLVTFPKPTAIGYAFVYEYYTDYTPQVACPSDVRAVLPAGDARLEPPSAGRSIVPVFMSALPSLACGKVYTAPRVTKTYQVAGSLNVQPDPIATVIYREDMRESRNDLNYQADHVTAEVLVYLDKDGVATDTYLEQSSASTTQDKATLTAAQLTDYAPATFLCAPTVSQYLFRAVLGSSK
jgi:hypothetical protein